MLREDTRGDFVDLADQLEHWVVRKLLLGEFALGDVTGISLPQDGVTITWNNLSSLEGRPEVVGDGLVAQIVTNGLLHLC